MRVARFVLPATLAGVAGGILAGDHAGPLPAGLMAVIGLAMVGFGLPARMAAATILGTFLAGAALGASRADDTMNVTAGASVASLADGGEHHIAGVVVEDPRPRGDRLQLVLDEVRAVRDGTPAPFTDRLLVWLPRGIDAVNGDVVRIVAEVELAEDFDGFAYREYLTRQRIGGIARARGAEIRPGPGGVAVAVSALRTALLGGLNDLVPEPEAALGAGILLGVRASIAPEINDAFATSGLTHVVAISGWNIAIVAALAAAAVRPLETRPGGRWTTAAVAASVVGGYVMLAGASPSVVRAALMAGAMLVARLGGSRAHAASALALAALVMLLAAPPVLWDVGFQLSLLATAGLVWFGASVERRLPGWPGWIREPVALTLAAQLTTLPVVLVNFERLSLVAPIANVLVVPFVPIGMLFSAIASVVGVADATVHVPLLGDGAAWLAGGAAWLTLWVIVNLGMASASVPFAALDVALPPALAIAWFGILALGTWALRDPTAESAASQTTPQPEPGALGRVVARVLRPVPVSAGLVVVLAVITFASRPDGRLHVTILDVGQGDAILVEAPTGATMLVDGGPDPELTLRRIGANLPFFARRIDLLVLSHPHQDHIAGLIEVIDRFRIGVVLHAGIGFDNPAYDRLLADAAAAGVRIDVARRGQMLAVDPVTTVRVLYPTAADASAPLPDGDINNGSVVLELSHGGFRALLTGDAEASVEASLIARNELRAVDVLKVGHHGSHSSTTAAFVAALRPRAAAISAGAGNEYGHPAAETLAALEGVTVYRTDLDGDIEVVSDGRTFAVRTGATWSAPVTVHEAPGTGSIGPWQFPTDPPRSACSTRPACPRGSSTTHAALPVSPWPRREWWPRPRSRLTASWSRWRRCCMTSTSWRFDAAVASTASSARAGSRPPATRSSRCRSPPTRSPPSSTRIASRWAGRRSSWPWPIVTWRRSS